MLDEEEGVSTGGQSVMPGVNGSYSQIQAIIAGADFHFRTKWRWQAGPFGSDCSRLGSLYSFMTGVSSPVPGWSHTRSLRRSTKGLGGTSLCIWGTDEKTLSRSASVVCVSAEYTSHCVLDSLPSFLPEDVIKDGQEDDLSTLGGLVPCNPPARKSR